MFSATCLVGSRFSLWTLPSTSPRVRAIISGESMMTFGSGQQTTMKPSGCRRQCKILPMQLRRRSKQTRPAPFVSQATRMRLWVSTSPFLRETFDGGSCSSRPRRADLRSMPPWSTFALMSYGPSYSRPKTQRASSHSSRPGIHIHQHPRQRDCLFI